MTNFLAFVCEQNLVECNDEKNWCCNRIEIGCCNIGSKYNDPNLPHFINCRLLM